MPIDRREFLKSAVTAGAGRVAPVSVLPFAARGDGPRPSTTSNGATDATSLTELFLDNTMIEVTPGVSRRLNPPQKHPLNPVVRPERWCEGNYIEPYTTMYDREDKLFKMWARAGSDWKSRYLDGHAAYMLYYTSKDGVHWDRPELGLMTIAGRRDHNIIFTSDTVTPAG